MSYQLRTSLLLSDRQMNVGQTVSAGVWEDNTVHLLKKFPVSVCQCAICTAADCSSLKEQKVKVERRHVLPPSSTNRLADVQALKVFLLHFIPLIPKWIIKTLHFHTCRYSGLGVTFFFFLSERIYLFQMCIICILGLSRLLRRIIFCLHTKSLQHATCPKWLQFNEKISPFITSPDT